ncbi:uncharacterized protein METZ01_LOCUS433892, partial [marine metagenome]
MLQRSHDAYKSLLGTQILKEQKKNDRQVNRPVNFLFIQKKKPEGNYPDVIIN